MRPQRKDKGVALERAFVGQRLFDPVASRVKAGDRRARVDRAPARDDPGRQGASE